MNIRLIYLLIICLAPHLVQAQFYVIEQEQSTYTALAEYSSISLDAFSDSGWPYDWEREFEFGFDFPFYGQLYPEVIMDDDGYGYFDSNQSEEYNFMMFAGDYIISEIMDTTHLNSDVRLGYINTDEIQAMVIEWHDVFLESELYENGETHIINYQTWFYSNGIIELRFGEVNLDNCSYYFPGQGFSFSNTNPENNIYGPWSQVLNNSNTEGASISGDLNAPLITYEFDQLGSFVLTSVPANGEVIRFIPSSLVSIAEVEQENLFFNLKTNLNQIEIIGKSEDFISVTVTDVLGKTIKESTSQFIQLNTIPNQIVLVIISTSKGIETHKVIMG